MPNEASEGLHKSMGFTLFGTYHNTGYKCGGWHDVAWFEKQLNPYDPSPSPILPVSGLSQQAARAILDGVDGYVSK